jgi:hypothetical protein
MSSEEDRSDAADDRSAAALAPARDVRDG